MARRKVSKAKQKKRISRGKNHVYWRKLKKLYGNGNNENNTCSQDSGIEISPTDEEITNTTSSSSIILECKVENSFKTFEDAFFASFPDNAFPIADSCDQTDSCHCQKCLTFLNTFNLDNLIPGTENLKSELEKETRLLNKCPEELVDLDLHCLSEPYPHVHLPAPRRPANNNPRPAAYSALPSFWQNW